MSMSIKYIKEYIFTNALKIYITIKSQSDS